MTTTSFSFHLLVALSNLSSIILFTLTPNTSYAFPYVIRPNNNYIKLRLSRIKQSSQDQTTSTTTSQLEKKAGEEGYSILRQPLNWDTESDPRFDAPKSLDESREESYKTKDAQWFQSRILGDVGNAVNEKNNENENEQQQQQQSQQQQHQQQRTEEFDQDINLFQRTQDTLDYPIVLNALRQQCDTVPAQDIITQAIEEQKRSSDQGKMNSKNDIATNTSKVYSNKSKKKMKIDDIRLVTLTAKNVQGIHDRYDAIKEMNAVVNNLIPTKKRIEPVPLSSCDFDIQPMLDKIDKGGVLDGPDILEVATILESILKVGKWCIQLEEVERQRKKDEVIENVYKDDEEEEIRAKALTLQDREEGCMSLIQLPKFGRSIYIDNELISLLENAFDDEGNLSGTTFPSIGRLRSKVRTLKNDILGTLDILMSSPSIKSKVSLESGGAVYSEVNGRIVIPIADKFKNSVGIIHDESRSGKTAYVEPTEIVRPTNEMRGAEMELRQEEMKVWRQLTNEIQENREDIEKSIAAVAQLDLVLARIRLGDKLDGVVPKVGDGGVISLKDARHPVLLLRELENVVGSDIDIGSGRNQGLVLTGPNR